MSRTLEQIQIEMNSLARERHNIEQRIADAIKHVALEPVDGDMLPPIGSRVTIKLSSHGDQLIAHTVVGYYVWPPHDPSRSNAYRVNIRVCGDDGLINARSLDEVFPPPTNNQGKDHAPHQ